MSRPTFDEIYMDVVETISRRSTCLRRQIGAVIVVDNRILSHGYNGLPSGMPNCCDTGQCLKEKANDENYKPCVHAEQNAICLCAKRGLAVQGGTIYINAEPCVTCAKLIVSCGVERVVIKSSGHSPEGIRFLLDNGVQVMFKADPGRAKAVHRALEVGAWDCFKESL